MVKRTGSCLRCGNCCQGMKLLPGVREVSHLKCPHLFIKHKVATCMQYEYRPQFCKDYPKEPADLIKGCGFKFVEK